jgi:outer membrane protein assembly factor BamB
MSTIPTSAFASELQELSHGEFKSFVAALWSRAGWETSLEGDIVVARKGDRTRRLLVVPAGRIARLRWSAPPDDAFSTVVVPQVLDGGTQPRGVPTGEIVDASDLRHRLVYAVDSEDADALCATHFGVAFRGSRWDQTGRNWDVRQVGQAVLAVVLVSGAVAVLVFGLPFVDGETATAQKVPPTLGDGVDMEIAQPPPAETVSVPENIPSGGAVYAGTANGRLLALDKASGEQVWERDLSREVGSPLVVDGVVYLWTADGVTAVDALTGESVWTQPAVAGTFPSWPTVVNDSVYLGVGENVVALDAEDGSIEWNRSLAGPMQNSPTVYDGTVYVNSPDGLVYALDATTGDTLWQVSEPATSFYPTPVAVPNARGAVVPETIIAAVDDTLFGFDINNGSTQWSYESRTSGPVSGPVVVNETTSLAAEGTGPRNATTDTVAYITDARSYVQAIDTETGEEVWTYEGQRSRFRYPVVGSAVGNQTAHTLYVVADSPVAEYESALLAINGSTGDERWFYSSQQSDFGPPTVVGQTLYTSNERGVIYAVGTANASERWETDIGWFPIIGAPTVVETPAGGDSVDSRVRLGIYGHHDWLAGAETNETSGPEIAVLNTSVTERVAAGEQMSVDVTLANRGNVGGEIFLAVSLPDTDQQFETTVELGPGGVEQRQITLTAPEETGEYTTAVRIANETSEKVVTVVERPSHVVTALDDPGQVWQNDEAEVIATIRNPGDVPATTPIVFEFNGERIETTQETIGANETTAVTFSFAPDGLPPGNYTYAVGTASDVNATTIEVRELNRRADAIPIVTQVFGLTLLLSGLGLAWRVLAGIWDPSLGRFRPGMNQ